MGDLFADRRAKYMAETDERQKFVFERAPKRLKPALADLLAKLINERSYAQS
jgi:hypothetical protein